MDDYISTFPGISYDWLVTVRASFTPNKAVWSSGMIPALGAGGPEFDPRLRPFCLCRFYLPSYYSAFWPSPLPPAHIAAVEAVEVVT